MRYELAVGQERFTHPLSLKLSDSLVIYIRGSLAVTTKLLPGRSTILHFLFPDGSGEMPFWSLSIGILWDNGGDDADHSSSIKALESGAASPSTGTI